MRKFVWDTSAILNIKEPNEDGYSPGHSFIKDLSDGWIDIEYQNIFPSLAVFEVNASVSRKRRDGVRILREFYIMDERSVLYDVDRALIKKSHELFAQEGFNQLRGADLVFACIASIEQACLVTLDKGFSKYVGDKIEMIDLNDSRQQPNYRRLFE